MVRIIGSDPTATHRLDSFARAVAWVLVCALPACSDGSPDLGPPVATLQIGGAPTDAIAVGDAVALTFTALDGSGNPVSAAKVRWSTSDKEVASVGGTGSLVAMGVGLPVTVVATSNGATDTIIVSVKAKIIDLGVRNAEVYGMNAAGQIGGTYIDSAATKSYGFRIVVGGAIELFAGTAYAIQPYAVGYGIDGAGRVCGAAYSADGDYHAMRWANGTMQDLGTLPGVFPGEDAYSEAHAANSSGTIVGQSTYADTLFPGTRAVRGFVWREGVGMRVIATLGGNHSSASAINDAGDIVGVSRGASPGSRAFIRYANTTALVDLGTLGSNYADATGVASNRAVTGTSRREDGKYHAYLWTRADGMLDLGSLTDAGWSFGAALNSKGQVTGTAQVAGGDQHAFIWTKKYGMIDLGSPFGGQSAGYAINDAGVVAGNSGTVDRHLVLWITRKPK